MSSYYDYNPFKNAGSGYYGNPYFVYSNPTNFGLPPQDYAFTSFEMQPNPNGGFGDSYISQWYNAFMGPTQARINDIMGLNWGNAGNPNGGGPSGGPGGSDPGTGNPTTDPYVSDLSTLGVTVPSGLTINDIEQLAHSQDAGRTIDGKIDAGDVDAAIQALQKAKSENKLNSILPGKDLTNLYVTWSDYLGAIKSKMPNPSTSTPTITSASSIADLGIENPPAGLTIDDVETLAGSSPKDGKIDKDEVKKAIDRIKLNKRDNTISSLFTGNLSGKDPDAILDFLNKAYTKLGGTDKTFNSNKEALQVLDIGENEDIIKDASGQKGKNKTGTIEGLQKIANGETKANDDLVAAAKYILANQGLLHALVGDDNKFSMSEKRYTGGGAHTRLANGADDLKDLINSDSVESYVKASNDMLGFKNYGEVLDVLNTKENREEIDKAAAEDGKTDGWGTMEDLKHIVDNPSKYNQKLVDAAKFVLQHPDFASKLGGTDGKFRMKSSVAGPAWWTNGQRDELRWLTERDNDFRNKTTWTPWNGVEPPTSGDDGGNKPPPDDQPPSITQQSFTDSYGSFAKFMEAMTGSSYGNTYVSLDQLKTKRDNETDPKKKAIIQNVIDQFDNIKGSARTNLSIAMLDNWYN